MPTKSVATQRKIKTKKRTRETSQILVKTSSLKRINTLLSQGFEVSSVVTSNLILLKRA